jgi:hypothetical protein
MTKNEGEQKCVVALMIDYRAENTKKYKGIFPKNPLF